MKKVCFLMHKMADGGVSKVSVKLANEIVNYCEVHLINLVGETNPESVGLDSRIRIKEVNVKKNKPGAMHPISIIRARKYIKDNDIDVVFGMGVPTNIANVLSTVGLKARAVNCDHSSFAAKYNKMFDFQRYIGMKYADKIIVLTERNLKKSIEKYNLNPKRIDYIYNWIDRETVEENPLNSKTIVTAGRLQPVKGFDLLMPVAKNVLSKHPDWKWVICGEGEQGIKQSLEDFIKDNSLENQLILKGYVKDMVKMYQQSEIYVLTSYSEGLPLVLLEAKSQSLPIVSFDVETGPSEIIQDGINGYLIKCYDTKDMSDKINQLIEDSELRTSFSQKAYLDVDKFGKNKILSQWINLIESFD